MSIKILNGEMDESFILLHKLEKKLRNATNKALKAHYNGGREYERQHIIALLEAEADECCDLYEPGVCSKNRALAYYINCIKEDSKGQKRTKNGTVLTQGDNE